MTRLAILAALLLAHPASAQAPAVPGHAPGTVVLTGATLRSGDGPPVENATVVLRDGRIVAAGAGVRAPAEVGSIVLPPGAVITPGLIATGAPLGLVEVSLEASTRDDAPRGAGTDPVRAAFRAADGYDPDSTLVRVARLGGITTALSVPTGGLISGTSAVVDLAGATPDQALVTARAAVHVNLDSYGVEAGGGAFPAALGRLRALLEDARLYQRQRAAYDRRQLRDLDASRADLDTLVDVLARRLPLVVRVGRAAHILRVVALAEAFGLRVVLEGAEEGWRVADALAEAEVPVILRPLTNLPESFDQLGSRYDNAALLAAAGVRLILTTAGAHDLRNVRQEAGNAVRFGLDGDAALAAITATPAEVFGMEGRGVVAPGRVANLVVWSGDPFELGSRPLYIFVRGVAVPLRSRQTALFERYRDLSTVRRGFPGRETLEPVPPAE